MIPLSPTRRSSSPKKMEQLMKSYLYVMESPSEMNLSYKDRAERVDRSQWSSDKTTLKIHDIQNPNQPSPMIFQFDEIFCGSNEFHTSAYYTSISPLVRQVMNGEDTMAVFCGLGAMNIESYLLSQSPPQSQSQSHSNPNSSQSNNNSSSHNTNVIPGLLTQAVSQLLLAANSVSGEKKATVTLSWYRIDCASSESIIDILKTASDNKLTNATTTAIVSSSSEQLIMREQGRGRGMVIPGLWEVELATTADIEAVITHVLRLVSASNHSRGGAHTIFQLTYATLPNSGRVTGNPISGRISFVVLSDLSSRVIYSKPSDSESSNANNTSTNPTHVPNEAHTYPWVQQLLLVMDWIDYKHAAPPFHKSRLLLLLRDMICGRQIGCLMVISPSPTISIIPSMQQWLQLTNRMRLLPLQPGTIGSFGMITSYHSIPLGSTLSALAAHEYASNVGSSSTSASFSSASIYPNRSISPNMNIRGGSSILSSSSNANVSVNTNTNTIPIRQSIASQIPTMTSTTAPPTTFFTRRSSSTPSIHHGSASTTTTNFNTTHSSLPIPPVPSHSLSSIFGNVSTRNSIIEGLPPLMTQELDNTSPLSRRDSTSSSRSTSRSPRNQSPPRPASPGKRISLRDALKSVTASDRSLSPIHAVLKRDDHPITGVSYIQHEEAMLLKSAFETIQNENDNLRHKIALLELQVSEHKDNYESLIFQLKEEGSMLERKDQERYRKALQEIKDYELYKEVMEAAMVRMTNELNDLSKENQDLKQQKTIQDISVRKQKTFDERYARDLVATKKKLTDSEHRVNILQQDIKKLTKERDTATSELLLLKAEFKKRSMVMGVSETDNATNRRKGNVLKEMNENSMAMTMLDGIDEKARQRIEELEDQLDALISAHKQEVSTLKSGHSNALEQVMKYQEENRLLKATVSAMLDAAEEVNAGVGPVSTSSKGSNVGASQGHANSSRPQSRSSRPPTPNIHMQQGITSASSQFDTKPSNPKRRSSSYV